MISTWKRQATEGVVEAFSGTFVPCRSGHDKQIKELHAKIGELTVERDFFSRVLGR